MKKPLSTIIRAGAALLLLAACTRSTPAPAIQTPRALAVPAQGAYTGAYMDFGDSEDTVTLEAIEEFENLVGKKQAIVASASFWGEQSFPRANLDIIARHGSVPLIYWSPWDKPYVQDQGPDRFSLTSIVNGTWDSYIDEWGTQAKNYGRPILVAWGLEMNGTWFPWSGWFFGKGELLNKTPKTYAGSEMWKKAYRHVVDRVRAKGATNISWVFHVNNYPYPWYEWNTMKAYYPGPEYVDWLGMSVYGKQFKKDPWAEWEDCMDYPYTELAALDPDKPIMLAEWGVAEFPKDGSRAAWIKDAFAQMPKKYPRLKAAVFWHERWENADGSYSNLRVQSTPESLETYRQGVARPFWLDRPEWVY
jgi:beta-mannanase